MKTLKILVITGLMLLPGLNLTAQSINYGIQAGFGVTVPHVPNTFTEKRLLYTMGSFSINGTIEYRFSGILGMSAEPGYIRKGGVARFGINRIMSDFAIQLNYVQLPILANLYFGDKFFISIGPEFAYLLNKDGNLDFSQDAFTPFEDNAFEISGLVGVNYSITTRIDLGLRYNHSLTQFTEVSWIDFPSGNILAQSKAYNQYFQFILRYRIKTAADM